MACYYYYLTVRARARGALKSACRGGGSLSRHVLDWACPRQVLGAMAWCAPQCSKPHPLASAPPRASPPLQLQQRHDRAPVTSTTKPPRTPNTKTPMPFNPPPPTPFLGEHRCLRRRPAPTTAARPAKSWYGTLRTGTCTGSVVL